jgi:hypothetical protein
MACSTDLLGPALDDLVAGRNLEDGGIRFCAVELSYGRRLLSGARILVDGKHVQAQIFGVPVFVDSMQAGPPSDSALLA